MALGALTLSVTQGVQGRPFQAKINGLSSNRVEVLGDGSPGFSTVNGNAMSGGLPYPVSTLVLREYEPGIGMGYRDSRIDIMAATSFELRAQAIASLGVGRSLVRYRAAGERQADGSIVYTLRVEDDLGATVSLPIGGAAPPSGAITLAASSPTFSTGTAQGSVISAINGVPAGAIPVAWLTDGSGAVHSQVACQSDGAGGWNLAVGRDYVGPGSVTGIIKAFDLAATKQFVTGTFSVAVTAGADITLSSTALADVGLSTGAASNLAAIDLGVVNFPNSPWTLGVWMKLGSVANNQPIFSYGDASDTIFSATSNMQVMGAFGTGNTQPFQDGFAWSGKDDAGVQLNAQGLPTLTGGSGTQQRAGSFYGGSNVNVQIGPQILSTSDLPTPVLMVFKRTADNYFEAWMIRDGHEPTKVSYSRQATFGALSGKHLFLSKSNKATTPIYGTSNTFQRPFMVTQDLSVADMRVLGAGVDPRQVKAFSAGAGDKLWQFTSTSVVNELVGGGTATLSGTWSQAANPIVPQAVVHVPRVSTIFGFQQVVQRNGTASSTLLLDGVLTGPPQDVYSQVIQFAVPGTVFAPWTKAGTSSGGRFGGFTGAVPQQLTVAYDIQLWVGTGTPGNTTTGTVYTMGVRHYIGEATQFIGQSESSQMRTQDTGKAATGAAAARISTFNHNALASTSIKAGWALTPTGGYGEMMMCSAIGDLLNCPVGSLIDGITGSPITQWQPGQAQYDYAVESTYRMRPKNTFWWHGPGSFAEGYSAYKTKLHNLVDRWRNSTNYDAWFHVALLPTYWGVSSAAQAQDIRRAQLDVVLERQAAGDTRISLSGNHEDIALAAGDPVHPAGTLIGYGRSVERFAQDVAFRAGVVTNNSLGPKLTRVVAPAGGTNARFYFARNGSGTGLTTVTPGNIIDYFEVATTSAMSSKYTITATAIGSGSGEDYVDVTLSAPLSDLPFCTYGAGKAGPDTTQNGDGTTASGDNWVYDNFPLYYSAAPGRPALPQITPIQAVAA